VRPRADGLERPLLDRCALERVVSGVGRGSGRSVLVTGWYDSAAPGHFTWNFQEMTPVVINGVRRHRD